MITASELAKRLAANARDVCAMLLPNGKREGGYWLAGSVNGEAGKSLRVCLQGDKCGVWADFNGTERGDLLDLWRLTRNLSVVTAIKQVRLYLGITSPKFVASTPVKFASFNKNKLKLIEINSPVFQYLTQQRKLSADTLKQFRIGEKK